MNNLLKNIILGCVLVIFGAFIAAVVYLPTQVNYRQKYEAQLLKQDSLQQAYILLEEKIKREIEITDSLKAVILTSEKQYDEISDKYNELREGLKGLNLTDRVKFMYSWLNTTSDNNN
jgi:hypothetical protein